MDFIIIIILIGIAWMVIDFTKDIAEILEEIKNAMEQLKDVVDEREDR